MNEPRQELQGFTSHGHRIAGVVQVGRPSAVARCGGPRLCVKCALEATAAVDHGEPT